jgi:membrane protein YdbS with pleckstrin-like domain
MSAEVARELSTKGRVDALAWRIRFVRSLGLIVALVGVVWTIAQPYRITLLDPSGQSFWWLLSEPPLYVVVVGIVYHLVIAPALARDLEE